MRILLQHARTQLYLRSLGNWTANPLEGFDFKRSQCAIDFARQHGINGVEIAANCMEAGTDQNVLLPRPAEVSARTNLFTR